MPAQTTRRLRVSPTFDADHYARLSEAVALDETRIARLQASWDAWLAHIHAHAITGQDGDLLLIWLDAEVEAEVDALWTSEPARAYLLHVLAVNCVMAAGAELVPELVQAGCAPVPAPQRAVREACQGLGLEWAGEAILTRRYALLTHFPWRGGCPACHLHDNCPGPQGLTG